MGIYILLSKLPKILVCIGFFYVLIRVIKAFVRDCILERTDSFWQSVCNFFDPYRQSIFYYKSNVFILAGLLIATCVLCLIYIPPEYLSYEKGNYAAQSVLINNFTYFISYLIHENLGHNMFCTFGESWFCYFSGDFMQVLVPIIVYIFSLQIRGALFFSPIIFYWLSSAIYDAGIYVSDAAASKLALTMSDMISDCAAGMCKGDWYYILKPFNAINYGEIIGIIFEIIACFIFALALYSVLEYIRRLMQNGLYEE